MLLNFLIFNSVTVLTRGNYPLSIIHYPLSIIHYPLSINELLLFLIARFIVVLKSLFIISNLGSGVKIEEFGCPAL